MLLSSVSIDGTPVRSTSPMARVKQHVKLRRRMLRDSGEGCIRSAAPQHPGMLFSWRISMTYVSFM